MKSTTQRLIVVLGMHRSGTSAVTRGLRVLGTELGNHFLPPLENINNEGFWEDVDLNQLNVEMLTELGSEWHHIAPLREDFAEVLRERGFLLRAVDLIREKIGESPVFGFKDPRVALLLPFWKQVFLHCDLRVSYLVAIRNPISVIRSLAQRDQFDLEKSTLLWLTYTLSILEGTIAEPSVVLVDYDRLVEAPERELRRISTTLDLAVDTNELRLYTTEFLDKNLRHTIYDSEDLALNSFTGELICDLYSVLLAAAMGKIAIDAPVVVEQFARARRDLDRWRGPLKLIDSLYHFKRNATSQITTRDSAIQELQSQLEQYRDELNRAPDASTRGGTSAKPGNNRTLARLIRTISITDSSVLQEALKSDWYKGKNGDVFAEQKDPYLHWLQFGSEEGRIPAGDLPTLFAELLAEREAAKQEPASSLRDAIATLQSNSKQEIEVILGHFANERQQLSQQLQSVRVEAEQARELGRQSILQQREGQVNKERVRERLLEALAQIDEQKRAFVQTITERDDRYCQQVTALIADFDRARANDRRLGQQQRDEDAAEFAVREQAWKIKLAHAEEQTKRKENEFSTALQSREELFAEQLQSHINGAQLRERDWNRRLDNSLDQIQSQNDAFLSALRDQENQFDRRLNVLQADAEKARVLNREVSRQQVATQTAEFARRESQLNSTVAELKAQIYRMEGTWLWRLRSLFTAPHAVIEKADENFIQFSHPSGEANVALPKNLGELLEFRDQKFVESAYLAILGRPVDPKGNAHYVELLRDGKGKLDIVWILYKSSEGRAYRSQLEGLAPAMRRLRWRRIPILSHFARRSDLHESLRIEAAGARAEVYELQGKLKASNSALQSFTEFDPKRYLKVNEDVATAAINPFEHYIRFGYWENRKTRLDRDARAAVLSCDWLSRPRIETSSVSNRSVDILIPVFNGYDLLGPLFESILANTRIPYRIIVIDDCSTDSRVPILLKEYTARFSSAILLTNEINQGFIGSVNRGMGIVESEFFVLQNSDTEVPPGWLERLIRPMQTDNKVATVTPFSNAATICSFPTPLRDNALYLGLSVAQIDAAFSTVGNTAEPIEIPTGVGFCMAMRKEVVDKIGLFDEIYGRGYGEENDWCRRAVKHGYRHVLVANLFVYHKHGGSFLSEEKARLVKSNLETLSLRYPDYHELIQTYIKSDAAAPIREFVKIRLLSEARGGAALIIDHNLGGGANAFRNRLVAAAVKDDRPTILFVHDSNRSDHATAIVHTSEGETSFLLPGGDAIPEFLKSMPIREVIYNNLVGSADPLALIRTLKTHIESLSLPLTIMMHDFYPICASYTLLDKDGRYCGVPDDLRVCTSCIQGISAELLPFRPPELDIRTWRAAWQGFIQLAREIRCFSESSRQIVSKAFPGVAGRCTVIPHAVDFNPGKLPSIRRDGPLHIGVVGGINYAKGRGVIESLIRYIAEKNLAYKLSVIGAMDKPILGVMESGSYQVEFLAQIIEDLGIHVILIPSIWPETFSYVTSEIMALGMPIACFDIGAPAERVSAYERGKILESQEPDVILKGLLDISFVD